MSKYARLIKDFFIFALGNVGSKFVVFFLVPFYTNILTAEEYGTSDLVFTFTELLMPLVCLAVYNAILRFGLERQKQPQNVLLCGVLTWGAGCLFSLLLMPLIHLYHPIAQWKWYLYAHVNASILLTIAQNYLKVKNQNLRYSVICILQTACLAGLNILLLAGFRMGIRGYLLSNTLAALVAAVAAVLAGGVLRDLKKATFDKALLRNMLVYSAPLILNNVSWWIIHSSNKVMIEAFVGAAALGLFTVASRIPSLINVVVTIFQQSWGISSIVEMDSTNDKSFYETVFQCYTISVFFVCLCLNTVIKPFMSIYVAADYFEAWRMVPLLVVSAAAFSSIGAFYGSMYEALKKSVNNMLTTLLAAVLNVGVSFALIPSLGAMGAVVGTLVSYCALAVARMLDVNRFLHLQVGYRKYAANCVLVVSHALLVMLDHYVVLTSLIVLLLFILLNRKFLGMILEKFGGILKRFRIKGGKSDV